MNKLPLLLKIALLILAMPVFLGIAFFIPAGTLDYWQAWVYMGILLLPVFLVLLYFMKKDRAFLERRMKMKEKEARQGLIIKVSMIIFIIAFLIPGLDRRFGWSDVPSAIVLAADAIVLLGYLMIFLVFRENSYAGRTVEVVKGQRVISTGPYSIIRHPMYVGVLLMYLATPIALGSYIAFLPFMLLIPIIVFRILNEEEVLRRELPGYKEYCENVRYRLLPFVW